VYFADPKLLKEQEDSTLKALMDKLAPEEVPIRFFQQAVPGINPSQEYTKWLEDSYDFTAQGVPASYGDNPGRKQMRKSADKDRKRFGNGEKALPLLRPSTDNRLGCRPHHSEEDGQDMSPDQETLSLPAQTYADTVLLLARGECTFFDKLRYAEQAGARGIIVTSLEGPVKPTLTEREAVDKQYAEKYLSKTGFLVVAGTEMADSLDNLVAFSEDLQNGVQAMVEVLDRPPAKAEPEKVRSREEWDALRKAGIGRPLFINGKRLHNAVLLF
jgi:hypothetical protein